MKQYLILSFIALVISACNSNSGEQTKPKTNTDSELRSQDLKKEVSLVTMIEQEHNKLAFLDKKNVSFDINLEFGGKKRLEGRITLSTDSRNGKIESKDGNVIIFKDGDVFCSRGMEGNRARFAAYTWSYFFMFPYKLSDEGTNWKTYENGKLKDQIYDAQKLTFDKGIGDAPDDWYIVYSDKDTHLINTAAYIVTAGATLEEAEKDPHAIEYCDYKEVAGIPIASTWRFWGWQPEQGLTDQLGNAQISNISFHSVPDDFYSSDTTQGTLVLVP